MISFNPAELAALNARLREVAEKIGKKALRTATRKAMTIVKNEARDKAPVDTGLLDSNFGILTRIKDASVMAKVGIRGGGKANPDSPFYFRFIEFGTKSIAAKPFLRPALENNVESIMDKLCSELKRELDKA